MNNECERWSIPGSSDDPIINEAVIIQEGDNTWSNNQIDTDIHEFAWESLTSYYPEFLAADTSKKRGKRTNLKALDDVRVYKRALNRVSSARHRDKLKSVERGFDDVHEPLQKLLNAFETCQRIPATIVESVLHDEIVKLSELKSLRNADNQLPKNARQINSKTFNSKISRLNQSIRILRGVSSCKTLNVSFLRNVVEDWKAGRPPVVRQLMIGYWVEYCLFFAHPEQAAIAPHSHSYEHHGRISVSCDPSTGIITFYRAQCNLLLNTIKEGSIQIGTVDSFQGHQTEVVILCLTKTSKAPSDFARDECRAVSSKTRSAIFRPAEQSTHGAA
ncbi:unnamed protein product [Caenorhabditis bovis]|uniref:DNA2/NAM7 helicase-like C-terminal domain-containing protein n=1 Tax=Caenorhabditis bovis TaxID=2654633 RepID=A0A8S1F6Q4_9PELO|nr:unnamed protein product [Caenorhabditis bovis]